MGELVFPIMHGQYLRGVPWAMLENHQVQAMKNHDQSLEQLASRGGLSPCEALAVIEDRPFSHLDSSTGELSLSFLLVSCLIARAR